MQNRIKEELKNFFLFNKGKLFCIVAAIGAVLAIPVSVLDVLQKKEEASIEFVDIRIDDNGTFPVLDVKLRNCGESVAYLYGLKVHLLKQYQIQDICSESAVILPDSRKVLPDFALNGILDEDIPFAYVDGSIEYRFELSSDEEQMFDISQAVYPDDVDRFAVALTKEEGISVIDCLYIELLYNEESSVSSSEVVLAFGGRKLAYDKNNPNVNPEKAAENYEMLLQFDQYTDAVRSGRFEQIFTSYEENKHEFMDQ